MENISEELVERCEKTVFSEPQLDNTYARLYYLKGQAAMITVGHCGYDSKHRTHLEMRRPCGTPDYTLLLVKTNAFFSIKGERVLTLPRCV